MKRRFIAEFDMTDESGGFWTRRSFHGTRERAEARVREYLDWFKSEDFNRGSSSVVCVSARVVEEVK